MTQELDYVNYVSSMDDEVIFTGKKAATIPHRVTKSRRQGAQELDYVNVSSVGDEVVLSGVEAVSIPLQDFGGVGYTSLQVSPGGTRLPAVYSGMADNDSIGNNNFLGTNCCC